MKVIIDTNILLRYVIEIESDKKQTESVVLLFDKADEIIIPIHVFCELIWVLRKLYKFNYKKLILMLREFANGNKQIIINEDEFEAGLKMMELGGDFADGVNAYTGRLMTRGVAVFASFDKQAVRLLGEQGIATMLLE
jgi:predicted nucleic-acid-binding protein